MRSVVKQATSRIWDYFLLAGLLMLFSFLLYFNSMKGEFHFDDYDYIVNAQQIRDIKNLGKKIFSRPLYPDRSLVEFSFSLNYAVHGLSYKGYQAVNIIIHALNGFLLYVLLVNLLHESYRDNRINNRFDYCSFFISLVFIAHPLSVNSVAYITQRHGLMAAMFYLCSFFCYIKAIDYIGFKKVLMFFFALLFFLFSIHCKPMSLTFPLAIASYSIIFREQSTWSLLSRKILLGMFFLFFLYVWWYAKTSGLFLSNIIAIAGFSTKNLWNAKIHFMTESKVFLHYLKLIFLPFPIWLCADRVFPLTRLLDISLLIAWVAHFIILLVSIFLFKKRYKLVSFGIFWFYITLLPYLVVPIQDVMVDYKTYLPSVGIMLAAGEIGYRLRAAGESQRIAVFATGVLILFSGATSVRIKTFKTEISFWTDVITKEGNTARAFNNRGLAWKKKGNYMLSIIDFNRAISISPNYYLAYANLGDAYLETGNIERSIEFYGKYLLLSKNKADAYRRMGNVCMVTKKWNEASKFYHKAVSADSKNAVIWYNLGVSYANMKKLNEAIYSFKRAVYFNPKYYQAYGNIGASFFILNNTEQAKKNYFAGLAINPQYADALYNLAILALNEGNTTDAFSKLYALKRIDKDLSMKLEKIIQKTVR